MNGRARKGTGDYTDPRMRQFSNKMGEVYQDQIKKRGLPKTKKPRPSERKYGSAINRRRKEKKKPWVGGTDERFKPQSSRLKSDTRMGRPKGKQSYMDIIREKKNKQKEVGSRAAGLGLSMSKDAQELKYLEHGYEIRDLGGRMEMYRPYQGYSIEGIQKKKMEESNAYASIDPDQEINLTPRSQNKAGGKKKVKRTRLGYKVARQRKVDSIMKMLETDGSIQKEKGYLTQEREKLEKNGGRRKTPKNKSKTVQDKKRVTPKKTSKRFKEKSQTEIRNQNNKILKWKSKSPNQIQNSKKNESESKMEEMKRNARDLIKKANAERIQAVVRRPPVRRKDRKESNLQVKRVRGRREIQQSKRSVGSRIKDQEGLGRKNYSVGIQRINQNRIKKYEERRKAEKNLREHQVKEEKEKLEKERIEKELREKLERQKLEDAQKMEAMMKEFAKKFNNKGSKKIIKTEKKKTKKRRNERKKSITEETEKVNSPESNRFVRINSNQNNIDIMMSPSSKNRKKYNQTPNQENQTHLIVKDKGARKDVLDVAVKMPKSGINEGSGERYETESGLYKSIKLGHQTFNDKDFSIFNQVRSKRKIQPTISKENETLPLKTENQKKSNKMKKKTVKKNENEKINQKNETEEPKKIKKSYIEILKSYNSQKRHKLKKTPQLEVNSKRFMTEKEKAFLRNSKRQMKDPRNPYNIQIQVQNADYTNSDNNKSDLIQKEEPHSQNLKSHNKKSNFEKENNVKEDWNIKNKVERKTLEKEELIPSDGENISKENNKIQNFYVSQPLSGRYESELESQKFENSEIMLSKAIKKEKDEMDMFLYTVTESELKAQKEGIAKHQIEKHKTEKVEKNIPESQNLLESEGFTEMKKIISRKLREKDSMIGKSRNQSLDAKMGEIVGKFEVEKQPQTPKENTTKPENEDERDFPRMVEGANHYQSVSNIEDLRSDQKGSQKIEVIKKIPSRGEEWKKIQDIENVIQEVETEKGTSYTETIQDSLNYLKGETSILPENNNQEKLDNPEDLSLNLMKSEILNQRKNKIADQQVTNRYAQNSYRKKWEGKVKIKQEEQAQGIGKFGKVPKNNRSRQNSIGGDFKKIFGTDIQIEGKIEKLNKVKEINSRRLEDSNLKTKHTELTKNPKTRQLYRNKKAKRVPVKSVRVPISSNKSLPSIKSSNSQKDRDTQLKKKNIRNSNIKDSKNSKTSEKTKSPKVYKPKPKLNKKNQIRSKKSLHSNKSWDKKTRNQKESARPPSRNNSRQRISRTGSKNRISRASSRKKLSRYSSIRASRSGSRSNSQKVIDQKIGNKGKRVVNYSNRSKYGIAASLRNNRAKFAKKKNKKSNEKKESIGERKSSINSLTKNISTEEKPNNQKKNQYESKRQKIRTKRESKVYKSTQNRLKKENSKNKLVNRNNSNNIRKNNRKTSHINEKDSHKKFNKKFETQKNPQPNILKNEKINLKEFRTQTKNIFEQKIEKNEVGLRKRKKLRKSNSKNNIKEESKNKIFTKQRKYATQRNITTRESKEEIPRSGTEMLIKKKNMKRDSRRREKVKTLPRKSHTRKNSKTSPKLPIHSSKKSRGRNFPKRLRKSSSKKSNLNKDKRIYKKSATSKTLSPYNLSGKKNNKRSQSKKKSSRSRKTSRSFGKSPEFRKPKRLLSPMEYDDDEDENGWPVSRQFMSITHSKLAQDDDEEETEREFKFGFMTLNRDNQNADTREFELWVQKNKKRKKILRPLKRAENLSQPRHKRKSRPQLHTLQPLALQKASTQGMANISLNLRRRNTTGTPGKMGLDRTWNSKSVSKHLKKSLFDETIEEVCQSNYNTQQSNHDFMVLEKQLEDAKKRRNHKNGDEQPKHLKILRQEFDKSHKDSKTLASALQTKEQDKFDQIIGKIFDASRKQKESKQQVRSISALDKSTSFAGAEEKTVEEIEDDALDLEAKLLRFKQDMEYEPSATDSMRLSSLKGFRASPSQWGEGKNLLHNQARDRIRKAGGRGRHMFRTMDEGFVKKVVQMGKQRFGDTISLVEEDPKGTFQWRKNRVKDYGRVTKTQKQKSDREIRRKSNVKRKLFKDWIKQKKQMINTLDKLDPNNIEVLVKENKEKRKRRERKGKSGSSKVLLEFRPDDTLGKNKNQEEIIPGNEVESEYADLKSEQGPGLWKNQKLFAELDPAFLGSIDQAVLENIRSRGKKGFIMSFDKDLNLENTKKSKRFEEELLDIPKKHRVVRTERSKKSLKNKNSKKKLKPRSKRSTGKLRNKNSEKSRMNKTVGGKKRSRDKKMRRNISDFKAKRLKEMKNTKKGFEIEMFIPEGSFNRTAHQDLSPEPRTPKKEGEISLRRFLEEEKQYEDQLVQNKLVSDDDT